MNILHLILGTRDAHYTPIEDAAKKTWITNSPENVKSIFMYGGEVKIYWDNDQSFYVNRPENHFYNICLYKTITAFEWFIDTDYDYIFRSNNTGYFDLKLLSDFIKDKPTENFYTGIIGEYENVKFASGSGYFLSKDLVSKIIDNKDKIYGYNFPGWTDDVAIGKFLTEDIGIEINDESRRLNVDIEDVNENLDMTHYHYRILNKGNPNLLYKIHELKNRK